MSVAGKSESAGAVVRLGEWVAGLRYADIPASVVEHAKRCLLDGLGCGLFGARQPWGRIAATVAAALSGGGPASLWGATAGASAADAALANGTAVHGFEIDDVHTRSLIHPGAVTIPAALALVEARSADGRTLLTALVAGYEVGLRVGIAAGVPHGLRGYHPTGTVGCVAAGAAGASVLGLAAEPAAHALAVAATQAAGLYSARTGAMAKRFHAGRAAQSGVIAALLAERGFTGSLEALDAPFGSFLSTLSQDADPAQLCDGLGQRWETLAVGFKAYAACASAHTIIDALDELMRRGLRHDDLAHLRIGMSRVGASNVGWTYVPAGVVAAQMNGYYTAAVMLLDGEAFIDQYAEERLADPRTLALIERIEIAHDPELDAGGASKRHAVRVAATTTDGRRYETYVEQRRGSEHSPLTAAEIEAKFRRTAGAALPPARVEELAATVHSVERLGRATELGRLLRSAS